MTIKRFFTPLLFFLFLSVTPVHTLMSSLNFTISSTVISGGGETMSSVDYVLTSTIGQPILPEKTSSTRCFLTTGFWHTLILAIIGDVDGDGDVDLEDVITALHTVTGQPPATAFKNADIDGDGQIGVVESIMILRKLGGL